MVAHHLEVLRLVRRRRIGVLLVEGVHHAHTFDRALLDAIDDFWSSHSSCFQDRGHDVDHVVELVTDAALVFDDLGPGHGCPLSHTAEV